MNERISFVQNHLKFGKFKKLVKVFISAVCLPFLAATSHTLMLTTRHAM